MNILEKRISIMGDQQLKSIRAYFDKLVVKPKDFPNEFRVLVALNKECQSRGIEWDTDYNW